MLKPLFLSVSLLLFLTGCVTQQVKMPNVHQTTNTAGTKVIGVSTVDKRGNDKLGSIGLATAAVGSELVSYTNNSVKQHLVSKGYSPVDAPDPQSLSSDTLSKSFRGKILSIEIVGATLNTFDALLAPAKTSIDITARVYSKGKNTHSSNCHGIGSKHIGVSVSGKPEGVAMAAAVDEALDQCMKSAQLNSAIR